MLAMRLCTQRDSLAYLVNLVIYNQTLKRSCDPCMTCIFFTRSEQSSFHCLVKGMHCQVLFLEDELIKIKTYTTSH